MKCEASGLRFCFNPCSFEEIPDPDSQFRLPVFTLTDNSATVDTKPVILIVSGEHARELITSEIIYWLSGLLTDDAKWEEASKWKALKDVENVAVSKGWADTNMRLWARTILQKAVIKVLLFPRLSDVIYNHPNQRKTSDFTSARMHAVNVLFSHLIISNEAVCKWIYCIP